MPSKRSRNAPGSIFLGLAGSGHQGPLKQGSEMPGSRNNQNRWVHGHRENGRATSEYVAWKNMKQRCYDPADKRFRDYGDRGIKVCERWLNSFENFLEDMGSRPTSKHSLGRRDNNRGYIPQNCVWQTASEQNRNRRTWKWRNRGF